MSNLLIVLVSLIIGMVISVGVVWLCIYILYEYPHSKLGGFIRQHLITDQDLEPINDEGSEPLKGSDL